MAIPYRHLDRQLWPRFQSISANGAANGIVLNNTGTNGGLTVASDGGGSNNGSGGTIQNTTGIGVNLTSTRNVSLGYMNIQSSADAGIKGINVTNFTLNRSNVTNNGNSTSDEGIQFGEFSGNTVGVTGTVTINNSSVNGNAHNNFHLRNTSGTIASFTVTGSSFNDLNDVTGANAFLYEMSGTAVTTEANITGSTFSNNSPQRALEVQVHDTGTISNFTVSGCTFNENGIHASFTQDTNANLTFAMLNNTSMLNANPLHAINVFSSSTSSGGSINGRIEGNVIGNASVAQSGARGNGIRVLTQGKTTAILRIQNNTIRQVWDTANGARGMDLSFLGPTASGQPITQSDITITNNSVDTMAPASSFPAAAIYVAADDQGSPSRVRADITGNTALNSVGGGSYDYPTFDGSGAHLIFHEVGGSAEGQLIDTPPASADATAQLTSTNTGTVYTQGITLIAGPINTPAIAALIPLIDYQPAPLSVPAVQLSSSSQLEGSTTSTTSEKSVEAPEAEGALQKVNEVAAQATSLSLTSAPAEPSTVEDRVQEEARQAEAKGDAPPVLATASGDEPAAHPSMDVSTSAPDTGTDWSGSDPASADPEPEPLYVFLASADPYEAALIAMDYARHRESSAEAADEATGGAAELPAVAPAAVLLAVPSPDVAIGTLPAGRSVTITYSVMVDSPFPDITPKQVSSQGTVSGTNFTNVLTDDPDTGTANDPTITPIVTDGEPPVVSDVLANPNPVAIGTPVALTATVDDATTGNSNVTSAEYSINGGTWTPMAAQDGTFDSPTESVSASLAAFTTAGLNDVCVRGEDAAGNLSDGTTCVVLAVYDPSAGFVTGSGTIFSPEGAYIGTNLTGEARFAFVSKYKKGKSVPEGNTQFRFKAADFHFNSTAYEYLVVAGSKAQFKGTGLINDAGAPTGGAFKFLLAAVDAEVNPNDGFEVDLFRIKIWYEDGGEHVVYDNSLGEAGCETGESAYPCTALTSGHIMIHKGGKGSSKTDDTLAGEPEQVPTEFALEGNYPNPFNPSTEIRFDLPEAVHATLRVYDVRGRLVAELVDAPLSAGSHVVTFDAEDLPSGLYLYRITAGTFTQTRRMILLK